MDFFFIIITSNCLVVSESESTTCDAHSNPPSSSVLPEGACSSNFNKSQENNSNIIGSSIEGKEGATEQLEKSKKINPIDPSSWVMAPVFVPKPHVHSLLESTNYNFDNESTVCNEDSSRAVGDSTGSSSSGGGGGAPKSYAQIVGCDDSKAAIITYDNSATASGINLRSPMLCPYLKLDDNGQCRFGDSCEYEHGDFCDMCSNFCLHPTNEAIRKEHQRVRGSLKLCI